MTDPAHLPRAAWARTATALAVLVATLAMLGANPAPAAPTTGARPTLARCSGSSGVSVEIDFRSLGGGFQTRCAPGSPGNGFEALSGAGIAYRTVRGGGFLCNISGVPASNCGAIPPASDYWVYWHKAPGGSWTYASLGAGSRTPPPGSTEGWSYYSAACDGPNPQPPGSSSRPNCKPPATQPPPTKPPPTPAPRPTPAPTPAPPTNGGGSTNGSGSGSGSNSDPAGGSGTPATPGDADNQPGPTSPSKDPKANDGSTTTTAAGTEDEAGTTDGSTTTGPDATSETTAADEGPLDEQAIAKREGTRDLGDDGTSGSSALPAILGVLLVGALAAAGVVLTRRNRAVPG